MVCISLETGSHGPSPTASAVLGGTATYNVPVNGILVSGPIGTGTVVVSSPGTTALNISATITSSTPSWAPGTTYRNATGTSITSMDWGGANNAKLFVSTTSTDLSGTTGGAVNVSTDNGNTFNQIGIIDVVASTFPTYGAPTIVSNTNWLLRIGSIGYYQSTDQGASWVCWFCNYWSGSNGSTTVSANVSQMGRSQNYATNNTFILGNKTNIVLETTNGGQSYTAILLPCATGGGISMIESDAYYFYNNTFSPAAPYFGVSTSPYTNAVFTPAMTGFINSLTRSGFDARISPCYRYNHRSGLSINQWRCNL